MSWITADPWRFWISLTVIACIPIGLVAHELRRQHTTAKDVAAAVGVAAAIVAAFCAVLLLVGWVGDLILGRYHALPPPAQAVVSARVQVAVFLFWFALCVYLTRLGAYSILASFAILGEFKSAEWRRGLRPYTADYWALVDRSSHLRSRQRAWIWLHHFTHSVAVFGLGVICLPVAFGMLLGLLVPLAYVLLVVMFGLNPDGADKRRIERLTAAELPGETESELAMQS